MFFTRFQKRVVAGYLGGESCRKKQSSSEWSTKRMWLEDAPLHDKTRVSETQR